jgi:hypothetical protein
MSKSDPLSEAIHESNETNGSKLQPTEEKAPSPAEPPYSIFTYSEKWMIVTIASTAGIMRLVLQFEFFVSSQIHVSCSSPLSTNIYFSAIPTIAQAFRKSTELINLTITVNMVVQGICEDYC